MEQYGFVNDVVIQEIEPSMQESTTTWDRLLTEISLLRVSEILPSLVSIKNASGLTSENGSIFLFPDPLWNGTREHVESLLREAQASGAASGCTRCVHGCGGGDVSASLPNFVPMTSPETTSSTRRFWRLPAAVAFEAIG
jgi:hypothetical protein